MRQELIQYVNLLFAGTDCAEVRDEILQNTLDRYDDLLAQGKTPDAAYQLAISGIGDISEILSRPAASAREPAAQDFRHKHAVSIALYILCPIPLFLLCELGLDTLGLCLTLVMVAAATALRITTKKGRSEDHVQRETVPLPGQGILWIAGTVVYLLLSFFTGAWYITWLLFPLTGAIQGLRRAVKDLKEAEHYEN